MAAGAAGRGARLAADIGGTFTDVVLETAGGALHTLKLLTTHTANHNRNDTINTTNPSGASISHRYRKIWKRSASLAWQKTRSAVIPAHSR